MMRTHASKERVMTGSAHYAKREQSSQSQTGAPAYHVRRALQTMCRVRGKANNQVRPANPDSTVIQVAGYAKIDCLECSGDYKVQQDGSCT